MKKTPPRLGLWLARKLAAPGRRDEIEGDLIEAWERRQRLRQRGRRRAFWADVRSAARTRQSQAALVSTPAARRWRLNGSSLDVRYALRLMRRQPAFTLLALSTLAIGIGASTAVFTICDRVLLRPLPYPEPDRVVMLDDVGFSFTKRGMGVRAAVRELPVFSAVGLYAPGGVNFGTASETHRLRAAGVTSGFFGALGVPPVRGRAISDDDDRAFAEVAVLSASAWARFFGREDVLGRSIQLNGRTFRIIGVMPAGLTFPEATDVWVPAGSAPQLTGAAFAPLQIARLAPGASIADALAALARLDDAARAQGRDPGDTATVTPLHDELTLRVRPTLLFLSGVVGLLLAVTAANLAGLMLSRLRVRERELLVRAALGAGGARLLRQVVAECAVFGSAGAACGWLAAIWSTHLFRASLPTFAPDIDLTSIDARFLAISVLVAAVTTLLFCLAPALTASRPRFTHALRQVDAHAPRSRWFGHALVVLQVAVAVVLLAAGTAALSSLVSLARVDVGFQNDRATLFELTLPNTRYADARSVEDFWQRLHLRLQTAPGFVAAGATSLAPGSGQIGIGISLRLAGAPPRPRGEMPGASVVAATPDYFRAMGITLLEGRPFTAADTVGSPPVAIVSRGAARQLSPDGAGVIGRQLEFMSMLPDRVEIVGVVDDVRLRGVKGPAGAQLYQPLAQSVSRNSLGVVIDSTEPDAVVAAARAALREVDPSLPMYSVARVAEVRARYLETERLTLGVSGAFAFIGLLLSAIGLYGVLSQTVVQRRREIGIRMALGANRARLRWEVVRSGLALTLVGVALGAAAALGAARAFASIVPGLTGPAPPVLAGLGALMSLIAVVASWAPARRASATDPIEVLKE